MNTHSIQSEGVFHWIAWWLFHPFRIWNGHIDKFHCFGFSSTCQLKYLFEWITQNETIADYSCLLEAKKRHIVFVWLEYLWKVLKTDDAYIVSNMKVYSFCVNIFMSAICWFLFGLIVYIESENECWTDKRTEWNKQTECSWNDD